jgi:hypothetical protein
MHTQIEGPLLGGVIVILVSSPKHEIDDLDLSTYAVLRWACSDNDHFTWEPFLH